MSLPTTAYQLAVLLLLVVPGIVYAAVRRRLTGPSPEDKDFSVRLVRAVSVSVVLDSLYALAAGPLLVRLSRSPADAKTVGAPSGFGAHPREAGLLALFLLVVVPALLALGGQVQVSRKRTGHGRSLGIRKLYQPMPTAWDKMAPRRGQCFVRIFTADGWWVGGWVGDEAYISTYPEPRDIFIDVEWKLSDTGEFVERIEDSLGLYVPLTGNERVAWVYLPEEEREDEPAA